jgi:hypothetical protein
MKISWVVVENSVIKSSKPNQFVFHKSSPCSLELISPVYQLWYDIFLS